MVTKRSKANIMAGSHLIMTAPEKKVARLEKFGEIPHITPIPPLQSSQPEPARNPPTTGYGINRKRFASLKRPIHQRLIPVVRLERNRMPIMVMYASFGLKTRRADPMGIALVKVAAGASCGRDTLVFIRLKRTIMRFMMNAPKMINPDARGARGVRASEKIIALNDTATITQTIPLISPMAKAGRSFGEKKSA